MYDKQNIVARQEIKELTKQVQNCREGWRHDYCHTVPEFVKPALVPIQFNSWVWHIFATQMGDNFILVLNQSSQNPTATEILGVIFQKVMFPREGWTLAPSSYIIRSSISLRVPSMLCQFWNYRNNLKSSPYADNLTHILLLFFKKEGIREIAETWLQACNDFNLAQMS